MKINPKSIVVIYIIFFLAFGSAGNLMAFHNGGTGYCEGCHTMHNSSNGSVITPTIGNALTKGSDASSTCLICHSGKTEGYHVKSDDGSNFTGGGDFYWLTKTFTWNVDGASNVSSGDNHGHNIIAVDYSFTQDATLNTATGGTYSSAFLGCTSCHDPHGKKNNGTMGGYSAIEVSGSYCADPTLQVTGNYRLLGDIGYFSGSGNAFVNDVPIARAVDLSSGPESNSNHTDYGQGMSEWCSNCHGSYSGVGNRHPSGNSEQLSNDNIYINYNLYVKTGDFSGTHETSFLALVPFERGTNDPTTLTPTSTIGPNASSNVMCLSCHRAHASAFENAARWDMSAEFISNSHPMAGDGAVTGDDVLNSYYGRDMISQFGNFQRGLCNKCHAMD